MTVYNNQFIEIRDDQLGQPVSAKVINYDMKTEQITVELEDGRIVKVEKNNWQSPILTESEMRELVVDALEKCREIWSDGLGDRVDCDRRINILTESIRGDFKFADIPCGDVLVNPKVNSTIMLMHRIRPVCLGEGVFNISNLNRYGGDSEKQSLRLVSSTI